MGNVVIDMSLSSDSFIAAPDDDPEQVTTRPLLGVTVASPTAMSFAFGPSLYPQRSPHPRRTT